MSAPFDPYHVWLGIPPEEQPASRYRLLGIRPFEAVADVIDNAADRQTAHLRTVQAGQHIKLAERLLNEIAAARICLLNPEKKAQYDRELRAAATAALSQAATLSQAAAGSAIRRAAVAEPLAAQTGTNSTAGAGANMRTAQPLTTAAALPQPSPAAADWDALIGNSTTTTVRGSGGATVVKPKKRQKPARIKLLGAGIGLLLAVAAVVAIVALKSPAEAVLAFDWPPADRAGATLVVDDQPVAIPAAGPWEFHCPNGTHRIFAKRPAFKLETTVTVAAGEHQLIAPQWQPKALLVLNWPVAERPGSLLLVDKIPQPADQRQPWEIPVEPGRHVVRATRAGAEPFEASVPVANDEQRRISVVLAAEPKLVIDWPLEQRKDATLLIDDTRVAVDSNAAALEWSLKPGPHTISISRPGFKPFEQAASLVAGVTTPLSPTWQPLTAGGSASTGVPHAVVGTVPPSGQNVAADASHGPPAAGPPKKLSPPSLAEQQRIAKELDEIYKPTHAPAKDRVMAAEMLKAAEEAGSSPVERFMLLKKGALLAAAAGDFSGSFDAVDRMCATYEVDAFAAKQAILKESIPALTAVDQVTELVAAAEPLINQAIAADQYAAALALVATAKEAIARRPADSRLFKDSEEQLARHRRDIAALQTLWTAVEDARETLKVDPANADANLVLGRWNCLLKNDWPSGLPFLAKGSDEGLKSLAKQELAGDLDVSQQNQLADGWWDRAQKETDLAHDGATLHASELYRLILPKVQSALKKAAIEQRLVEASTVSSHGGRATSPLGASFHHDQWIDLLQLVDPASDGVYGNWTHKGTQLVCEPDQFSRIRFPIELTGSYDLELDFARNEGADEVVAMIPVGERPFMVLLSALDGSVSGLGRIVGASVRDQRQFAFRPGTLVNNRRCHLLINVRVLKDHTATVDAKIQGKAYWPQWRGPLTQLSAYEGWGLPNSRQPGIGAWNDRVTFYAARLRVLSGETTVAPAMKERPPTVRILRARFGGGSNWADVTSAVQNGARNGEWVWATTDYLHADPTPGWRKHLELTVEIHGKQEAQSIDEGGAWKIIENLAR